MERTFDVSGKPERFSSGQITSWCDLAGVTLRRDELRVLRMLDNLYCKVMR
jgi:hypothetical protein